MEHQQVTVEEVPAPVAAETQEPGREVREDAPPLTPQERRELAYQRALAKLQPGSAQFKTLRRSFRSMHVFQHHAMFWPKGRELTENGRARR